MGNDEGVGTTHGINKCGKVSAVIPAAGEGKRLGRGRNKLFLRVKGKPILAYTLEVFERSEVCSEVIVVLRQDDLPLFYEEVIAGGSYVKLRPPVLGGRERQDSVLNGLLATDPASRVVAVHDGARPLVDEGVIARTVEAAFLYGAAIAAIPVKDTIKLKDAGGFVSHTLPRDQLINVQTPQAFERGLLLEAYRYAKVRGISATDDSALVEAMGYRVRVVMGSYRNLKITTPEDIAVMEMFLGGMRKGGEEVFL